VNETPDSHQETTIRERSRFCELPKDGAVENAVYVDNSYMWAGGGFLSTAEDLVRFGSELLAPGELQTETLKTMFTPQKTKSGEATGYGIGWAGAHQQTRQFLTAFLVSGGSPSGSTNPSGLETSLQTPGHASTQEHCQGSDGAPDGDSVV
jgi:CubicO group peptidase (beta-lactamase class C family)